jgi:hypothetical protein
MKQSLKILTVAQLVKEFPVFWNIKVYNHVHKSPILTHNFSQMYLVYILPSCVFKLHYNIIILRKKPIPSLAGKRRRGRCTPCYNPMLRWPGYQYGELGRGGSTAVQRATPLGDG